MIGTAPGHPGIHPGYPWDTAWIHPGYSRDSPGILPGYTRDTPGIPPGYTRDIPGTPLGYRLDTPRIHLGYPWDTDWIHPGCTRDAHGILPGYTWDTPGTPLGYCLDTPGTAPGYCLDTPRIHPGHSWIQPRYTRDTHRHPRDPAWIQPGQPQGGACEGHPVPQCIFGNRQSLRGCWSPQMWNFSVPYRQLCPGLAGPVHPSSAPLKHPPFSIMILSFVWGTQIRGIALSHWVASVQNRWDKMYGGSPFREADLDPICFCEVGERRERTGVFIFRHWKENLALFHVCAYPQAAFPAPLLLPHTPWLWLPLPAVSSSVQALCFAISLPILF